MATLQHQGEDLGMVLDMQSVTNIFSFTVNRQGLAAQGTDDGEWDQLLGK